MKTVIEHKIWSNEKFSEIFESEYEVRSISEVLGGRFIIAKREKGFVEIYVPRTCRFYKITPTELINGFGICKNITLEQSDSFFVDVKKFYDEVPTIEAFVSSKPWVVVKVFDSFGKLTVSLGYNDKIIFEEWGVDLIDAFMWAYVKMLQYMANPK